MKFTPTDQIAMLTAAGGPITIGRTAAFGIFQLPGRAVDVYSGAVMTASATLLLSEADAALVTVNDTVIEIDYQQYHATQKQPDGAGLVLLELTGDIYDE